MIKNAVQLDSDYGLVTSLAVEIDLLLMDCGCL